MASELEFEITRFKRHRGWLNLSNDEVIEWVLAYRRAGKKPLETERELERALEAKRSSSRLRRIK